MKILSPEVQGQGHLMEQKAAELLEAPANLKTH